MWSLIMVAAVAQLPYDNLPGFNPADFAPPPRAALTQPAGPLNFARVPDSSDAVAWAVQDLKVRQQFDPHSIPFLRYLWIPPWGTVEWHQTNSLIINSACSQSSLIVLPESAAGGWLIVWDLRKLAPKADDLRRLLIVWDALAINEPYFHAEIPGGSVAKCRTYTHIDGKQYSARRFVPAPHVEPGYSLLEAETHSFAPLVRADDFLRRMVSTVAGGLYYHAIGFVRDGKRLTEAEIFKQVGLDVLLSRKVEGDDRAAVFQSAVTEKPRTVEQVQGAIGRARVTYDIFDEDVDPARHAIYDLLNSIDKARGKEIIFERANGTLGFVLTDGAGKLVDVAPQNLVTDHRVPPPATANLFPMLSCLRCHGPTGGIQDVRNDVPTLLGGGTGEVDYFDNLNSKDGRFATVDRITGLYAASDKFNSDLADSRNKFADVVFRATRGMSAKADENVVPKALDAISRQYADYFYARSLTEANVNPDRACLELGYKCQPGQGAAVLRQIIPVGRVDAVIDGVAVEFADPALSALRRGMSIRRQDWQRIAPYAAYQVQQFRKGQVK